MARCRLLLCIALFAVYTCSQVNILFFCVRVSVMVFNATFNSLSFFFWTFVIILLMCLYKIRKLGGYVYGLVYGV